MDRSLFFPKTKTYAYRRFKVVAVLLHHVDPVKTKDYDVVNSFPFWSLVCRPRCVLSPVLTHACIFIRSSSFNKLASSQNLKIMRRIFLISLSNLLSGKRVNRRVVRVSDLTSM